ncbi:hypothetical protein [Asticcacaulis sp.]|jgi:hypothetical protein|uniref:hypothetical protein n=1 Tax=Asticcacaulis sp. TaxID=1872648 RepID=UPI003F7B797B
MMKPTQITDKLFYGADAVCTHDPASDVSVVHACKTCHSRRLGYSGSLAPTHPNYLAWSGQHHLYLNLIDPPAPLFKLESFDHFFRFADVEIRDRPLLIHCNQGESRAPSLALLYMAKRLNLLPDESYQAAKLEFEKQFVYRPGKGIQTFLGQNWASLGK